MKAKKDIEAMRLHTMGCWWPSKITGRKIPNWVAIADELEGGAVDELQRGGGDNMAKELHRLSNVAHKMV